MSYKILLTGGGSDTIDLFFTSFAEDYECMTTSLNLADMKLHMKMFHPDIFAFCMNGESEEMYDRIIELKKSVDFSKTGIAIIGPMEQCGAFQTKSNMLAKIALMTPASEKAIKKMFDNYLYDHASSGGSASAAPAGTAAGAASSGRKSILIIDDDPIMLKLIKSHLRDDYEIAAAKGGAMAYPFLQKKHADLILLDYEMPDENGPTVFQKIRQISGYANTPIVFLTGVAEMDKIAKVAALKPQGYLLKPIVGENLIAKVKELIG